AQSSVSATRDSLPPEGRASCAPRRLSFASRNQTGCPPEALQPIRHRFASRSNRGGWEKALKLDSANGDWAPCFVWLVRWRLSLSEQGWRSSAELTCHFGTGGGEGIRRHPRARHSVSGCVVSCRFVRPNRRDSAGSGSRIRRPRF